MLAPAPAILHHLRLQLHSLSGDLVLVECLVQAGPPAVQDSPWVAAGAVPASVSRHRAARQHLVLRQAALELLRAPLLSVLAGLERRATGRGQASPSEGLAALRPRPCSLRPALAQVQAALELARAVDFPSTRRLLLQPQRPHLRSELPAVRLHLVALGPPAAPLPLVPALERLSAPLDSASEWQVTGLPSPRSVALGRQALLLSLLRSASELRPAPQPLLSAASAPNPAQHPRQGLAALERRPAQHPPRGLAASGRAARLHRHSAEAAASARQLARQHRLEARCRSGR